MRILVVDDERAVRESLQRALELEGYEIELAADGREALARLENGEPQPDAVILDVLMPVIDGLEVCRRLRRQGNRVPVLMLTARDEIENRVAGLDAGADDYVPKPFALEELVARIRALLRRTTGTSDDVLRFAAGSFFSGKYANDAASRRGSERGESSKRGAEGRRHREAAIEGGGSAYIWHLFDKLEDLRPLFK